MRKRTQQRLDQITLYLARLKVCENNDERDEAIADLLREHKLDAVAEAWQLGKMGL